MTTVESLTKRLDDLDEDCGYFRIEDFILACPLAGETLDQAVHREHPFKTVNPAMLRGCLEDWSK